MIVCINYADDRFRPAQKLNTKSARKYGADRVIEYSPADIPEEFKEKHKDIFSLPRGAGYWIWKPYILKDALAQLQEGDYLVYTDSGCTFIRPISLLIDAMEHEAVDVMPFASTVPEYMWSKRDAFVLMGCDDERFYYSVQIQGTFLILKKTNKTEELISEFLRYATDYRVITDAPNVMGKENLTEFRENRHDQTIWSLLCKKNGIKPFREPSQYAAGWHRMNFSEEVNRRSPYPQVVEHHRKSFVQYYFQLNAWKLLANYPKAWKWFARISCAVLRIPYKKNPYKSPFKPVKTV